MMKIRYRKTWDVQEGIIGRILFQSGGSWFWDVYRDEFEPDFREEIDKVLGPS